jgi:hypothetical protein
MDRINDNGTITRNVGEPNETTEFNVNKQVDKNQIDINISIDEYEQVKRERDEFKADLELLAKKELDRQAQILGCEATVEAVQNAKLNHSDTALLSSQDNDSYEGFNSCEDAINALNHSAKLGNVKATEYLNKLGKKALEKPINYQYEGSIKDIARKPVKSSTEKQEDFDARLGEYKKRQSWRDLNSVKSDGE